MMYKLDNVKQYGYNYRDLVRSFYNPCENGKSFQKILEQRSIVYRNTKTSLRFTGIFFFKLNCEYRTFVDNIITCHQVVRFNNY